MSDHGADQPPPDLQQQEGDRPEDDEQEEMAEEDASSPSSSSSSDYDSDYSSDDYGGRGEGEGGGGGGGGVLDQAEEELVDDNSPEANFRSFAAVLDSRRNRRKEEEEDREYEYPEDLFNFPRDPERWREEDLRELWADGPMGTDKTGWDPVWADEDDWEAVKEAVQDGHDPPIAPFYLPYRKCYPVIPDNHHDISTPKAVVEELDRIEEFLQWVSYIFEDGSSYEGTIWDDLAHGKGVYVAEQGLVRYEGEWLQNQMEGHGVVEVEIPGIEPVPGSKLEAKMRAEGRIISRDFMSPEDRKWLEMDIEDSLMLSGGLREIPFYERKEWVEIFGRKPEKGRYRYAGQWKHGRMHGCGVYELNERLIFGKFYFGEYVEDSDDCNSDTSMLHAGIAEVAAAKARMFINKPDGMVREERGPFSDPQHPYFYEEEDVWMAPGFINQFYDVPDYWKTYVEEVDQERQMWLNSFYKAPLRIPMPAELEYWWSRDNVDTEFVLFNKEPEPDPEDPSKLIYPEDPLILHTPTGRIINYVEDEEHGIRLFWQPILKEGEEVDPDKAEFLPLGYDEFFGGSTPFEKQGALKGMLTSVCTFLKPYLDRLQSWAEEKKKAREMDLKLIEKELEFVDAEIDLGEALEDLDMELKRKQEEEEKRAVADKDQDNSFASAFQDEILPDEKENAEKGEEEEEEDDDDGVGEPTSFGIVNQGKADDGATPKDSKPGKSPFSSLSLCATSPGLLSMVPPKLRESFLSWKTRRSSGPEQSSHTACNGGGILQNKLYSVKFQYRISENLNLRAVQQRQTCTRREGCSSLNSLASICSAQAVRWQKHHMDDRTTRRSAGMDNLSILSLQIPIPDALPTLL